MKVGWGTRGFSRVFAKSGGKALLEKFLWSNH